MPFGPPSDPILYSFPSTDVLVDSLAHFIIKTQKEAIEKKGRFTIALSGGSLPKQLKGLVGRNDVKWDLWCVVSHPFRCLNVQFPNANIDDERIQARLLRR